MKKVALITGITGQDGAYLAELLLDKGYEVHGLRRRVSVINIERISHLLEKSYKNNKNFFLHYGDMGDTSSVIRIMQQIKPDEVYNLAAQSHVHVSFDSPEYTANSDAIGTLRILEAIRILNLKEKTKFYQASTSELYGKIQEPVQNENTPFYPRSPYAVAKLYSYWITVNYREAYGIYACNGILFNHESPIRGETFVTRKITKTIARILFNKEQCLYLGNIDARRDWGHAKDYVRMQWMMLQQKEPEDYVIATGKNYSVREFIEVVLAYIGVSIVWEGCGVDEIGIVSGVDLERLYEIIDEKTCPIEIGKKIIKIDKFFYRPTEVDTLLGDPSKAKHNLGWEPEYNFESLVREMIDYDIELEKN